MVTVLTKTATNSGMLTCGLMTEAHSDIVGELSTIVRLSVSHSITTANRQRADTNVILNYSSTNLYTYWRNTHQEKQDPIEECQDCSSF